MCLIIVSKHFKKQKKFFIFLFFSIFFNYSLILGYAMLKHLGKIFYIMSTKIKLFTILKGKICFFFLFEILTAYIYIINHHFLF